MEFPLMNVSNETWKQDDYLELVLWDKFIYTTNEEYILNYISNKTFCDCKGNLYKAFDIMPPTSFWRRTLYFLPNMYKTEVKLRRTGENMSVDTLRTFMLDRLRERPPDEFYNKLKEDIKISDSYIKLMFFGAEN